VLVVRRDYYLKNEETVHKLLQTYFVTLRLYAMDRQKFVADMAQVTGLPAKQTEAMLGKIDFLDVQENATKFFGVKMGDLPAAEGMVNVILSCMDVMKRVGVPLASELKNPYELTNRGMIERLVTTMPQAIGQAAAAKDVPALDLAAWRALKEVGALRIEPISFQSGAELLDQTGKEEVDRVAYLLLNNYPGYRVIVRGHTGPGDEQANRELSQNRAEVVKRYLEVTHSIDPDRMLAEGMGFTQPPKARPGESQRSLRSRAPRVEFVLVEGNDL
jgi:outer membrane protein OmpA-like peptidoglycan-associated protein